MLSREHGSAARLLRELVDWADIIGQGLALVTYKSALARDRALSRLESMFEGRNKKTLTLRAALMPPEDFVRQIAGSQAEVVFVLDPDEMLFSGSQPQATFWVNFNREALVGRPGVQIWWFPEQAAIRFARDLPDLNRFFLFREELSDDA